VASAPRRTGRKRPLTPTPTSTTAPLTFSAARVWAAGADASAIGRSSSNSNSNSSGVVGKVPADGDGQVPAAGTPASYLPSTDDEGGAGAGPRRKRQRMSHLGGIESQVVESLTTAAGAAVSKGGSSGRAHRARNLE
jgi:hypothetical protein